jgi:hypothetical protein
MNPIAFIWVILITIIFCLPFTPAAVFWDPAFDWRYVNYAPITVIALLIIVTIVWFTSARHHFTGQVRTIEKPARKSRAKAKPRAKRA